MSILQEARDHTPSKLQPSPEFTPIREFKGVHILSAQQWDRENLAVIHERTAEARKFHETKRGITQLRGRLAGAEMLLGIYQLSSRTRLAFDIGMKRVGG